MCVFFRWWSLNFYLFYCSSRLAFFFVWRYFYLIYIARDAWWSSREINAYSTLWLRLTSQSFDSENWDSSRSKPMDRQWEIDQAYLQCWRWTGCLHPGILSERTFQNFTLYIIYLSPTIRTIIISPSPLIQILNHSLRKNFESQKHISKTPWILNCIQINYISALQVQRSRYGNLLWHPRYFPSLHQERCCQHLY